MACRWLGSRQHESRPLGPDLTFTCQGRGAVLLRCLVSAAASGQLMDVLWRAMCNILRERWQQ